MITYDWDAELVEDGDVLDHDHSDKLAPLMARYKGDPSRMFVLIRNKVDGSLERSWAYVEAGVLPENFTDSGDHIVAKVPKRFHQELAVCLKSSPSHPNHPPLHQKS